jgi:hypothetical protein
MNICFYLGMASSKLKPLIKTKTAALSGYAIRACAVKQVMGKALPV